MQPDNIWKEGMNKREGEYNFTSQHVNFMVLTVKEILRDMVLLSYQEIWCYPILLCKIGEEFRRSSQLNEYQGSFPVVCFFNNGFIRSPHYWHQDICESVPHLPDHLLKFIHLNHSPRSSEWSSLFRVKLRLLWSLQWQLLHTLDAINSFLLHLL